MAIGDANLIPSAARPQIPVATHDIFTRVAAWTIRASGGRWGFLIALLTVVIWAVSGPFFRFSPDWQLVVNTGTSIVTFLMVFLIQNAQNRESKAVHLKLDELILAVRLARNELIDIEHLTEAQLDRLSERYTKVAQANHHKLTECFEAPAPSDPDGESPAPASSAALDATAPR